MSSNKEFFSFETFIIVMLVTMVSVTVAALVKSAADDANTLKVDSEIKRTYMQWAKDNGQKGKDSVNEYLRCLKYGGNKHEVGNWFPDKKDCLLINKDKGFVEQMTTNIRSLDVSDKYKKEVIGELDITKK